MAVERLEIEDKDKVLFSFMTPTEGRDALKTAIDLVAGECGDFAFIPIMDAGRGYVGFAIGGDTNALSALTYPRVRNEIKTSLKISDRELDSMFVDHMMRHNWFKRPKR